MKKLLILATICMSTTLFAEGTGGCGNFNINVSNNSGHTCTLRSATTYGGAVIKGGLVQEIANGTRSPTIQVQQGYFSGANIRLDFVCENKIVVINSQQNYCFLSAGNITGQMQVSNNIRAVYLAKSGSYWSAMPGQISWSLY